MRSLVQRIACRHMAAHWDERIAPALARAAVHTSIEPKVAAHRLETCLATNPAINPPVSAAWGRRRFLGALIASAAAAGVLAKVPGMAQSARLLKEADIEGAYIRVIAEGPTMLRIETRLATPDDVPDLAKLMLVAGNGLFEAMFEGAVPGVSTRDIAERRFHRLGTTKSYENCWVAEHGKRVIGSMNAYPMDDATVDPPDPLFPAERRYLVEPFAHLEAPGSFHLNTVAVLPEHRGQGIGTRLLSLARSHARNIGLSELSLIVFERNIRAVALYERVGFRPVKHTPAASHESLHYAGNLVLMTRPV
jgi:ribosomal protein S18 acetylase RimI-like enzyme